MSGPGKISDELGLKDIVREYVSMVIFIYVIVGFICNQCSRERERCQCFFSCVCNIFLWRCINICNLYI